jgi:hypothetical protein
MKKLFALITLVTGFAAGSLSAQDFSGTITWSMRVEITDPAMKKQMAEAQAQLADPKIQAQIKEAQEAMKSPEMQAMLQANPQMKAMMEQQMAAFSKPAAAGGDPLAGIFPKGFTLQLKGPRSLVKTEGGPSIGDVLTLADQNLSYRIDRTARTYSKLAADPVKEASDKYKITPTTETAQVLGYKCKRYQVDTLEGGAKTSYSIWATNDIKGLDAKSLRRLNFSKSSDSAFMSQIDGVPLKIDVITPDAKLFMVATGVKNETLPDSLFVLPAGFKEVAAPVAPASPAK